jgi:Luciferase-like monooxygenase
MVGQRATMCCCISGPGNSNLWEADWTHLCLTTRGDSCVERSLQLSVLDQSPVRDGGTAAEALQETIALAIATEAMGYQRFWVAEHHNLANFAGTSPEILIGQIAARTRTMRVGSGGVMLTHYSVLGAVSSRKTWPVICGSCPAGQVTRRFSFSSTHRLLWKSSVRRFG